MPLSITASKINEQTKVTPDELLELDSSFRTVDPKNYRTYFKKGRVFKIFWPEPVAPTEQNKTAIVSISKWSEQVFVKIRWFLVVQPLKSHCIAVSIHTYGRRGVAKSGVDADDHAALVVKGQDEVLLRGENLKKQPLHLILEDKTVQLNPVSRIDFSKIYTVEYNVKVSTVGRIAPEDLSLLDTYVSQPILKQRGAEQEQEPEDEDEDSDGLPARILEGHKDSVNAVVFSPNGNWLASASDDETVILWDATTGAARVSLKGHTGSVVAMAFSPDSKQLASASDDNTTILWNTTTGAARQTLKGHTDSVIVVAFSPDGKHLASASDDKMVMLWDATTGATRQSLRGHTDSVIAIVFSPDGKWLASASVDNTVRLWDTAMAAARHTLKGHRGPVITIVFSPDGKLLASASDDCTVKLWDVVTGAARETLEVHNSPIIALIFSLDGKWLASASDNNRVWLWDVATGRARQNLKGPTDSVIAVAFSSDGKQLASASDDNRIRLWDATTGAAKQTLKGHTGSVISMSFSPDGKWLASASNDKTVRLWDTSTKSFSRIEHQTILDWLTPIDYAPQQRDFISQRCEGTGLWFLESPQFLKWLNIEKQTLFCPGVPGAGKSIIAALVVEYLQNLPNKAGTGIAYLYCSFRQSQQKPEALLASLLKQLVQKQPSMPHSVKVLYDHYKGRRTRASLEEISKALHSVATTYSRVFIIVDALDECQESNGCRTRFLSEILDLQAQCGVSLFATSRFVPEITKKFEGSLSLEIRTRDKDVERYLDDRTSQLPIFAKHSPNLQNKIKLEITKAADGMFLYARLHLDSLMGMKSTMAIRIALNKLPAGLDGVYRETLQRIEEHRTYSRKLAKEALSWITCAKRPLTTTELQHALAVKYGATEIDEGNLPPIDDIVSACTGLVTIDRNDVIHLVHNTVQIYLERTRKRWFPEAEKTIATTCITYLSFDTFESGFCQTDDEFERRLRSNPLYDYAARNWGHHARPSPKLEKLILNFLESEAKVSASSQAMIASQNSHFRGYSQQVPRHVTGLHIAAYFGLEEATNALLQRSHKLKDTNNRTPLSYAAENGHKDVVELLLKSEGVYLDFKDKDGRTPLSWAALNGHEMVVTLLLERGAELESKDKDGRTPLSWAAQDGYEMVVTLLLEEGAELESKDKDGRTPLSWAALNGHETVVTLLLEKGADLESMDRDGRTPLSWASEGGHETVVMLLLEEGAELESMDKDGRTPLSWAALNGHETVVTLLLERGAELESKDKDGRTPLSWAAQDGYETVVTLLLEKGAELESMDKDKWTLLSWATERGHEAVVKLLLAAGKVDVDSKDSSGRTPLSLAAERGYKAVVEQLLATGKVDIDSRDSSSGRTPLSLAAANGHEAVVKLLLAAGKVDVDSKDSSGRTPLSLAVERGHEAVVEQLLATGKVDVDSKDSSGRTPLSLAAERGHEAVVEQLLATGKVDVDSKGSSGRTPLSLAVERGHEAVVKLLLASTEST